MTTCKRVEAPNILPGWGCCQCLTYNGLQRQACKACGHMSCLLKDAAAENRGRMFFANLLDTGLMALDQAKTTIYHGTPKSVAEKMRQIGFDVAMVAAAFEESDSFQEAMKLLAGDKT